MEFQKLALSSNLRLPTTGFVKDGGVNMKHGCIQKGSLAECKRCKMLKLLRGHAKT